MNYHLNDKVAVITGAGGAICGEIAKAFAGEGILVAVWDVSLDAAKKNVKRLSLQEERRWP